MTAYQPSALKSGSYIVATTLPLLSSKLDLTAPLLKTHWRTHSSQDKFPNPNYFKFNGCLDLTNLDHLSLHPTFYLLTTVNYMWVLKNKMIILSWFCRWRSHCLELFSPSENRKSNSIIIAQRNFQTNKLPENSAKPVRKKLFPHQEKEL